MTKNEYLSKILAAQTLGDESDELKALQKRRAEVEKILRDRFGGASPTIRYGGSKAKGTMIRESYDLDIICYFPHDETGAGETLEDIYNNLHKALLDSYFVELKASALRLKDKNPTTLGLDFHIDVVPGRFVDAAKADAFLYISTGEKMRLKTNLDVHINYVEKSGVTDAIRLMKLWRVRNGIGIRNFLLELLTIKLLKGKSALGLSAQFEDVWETFRDKVDGLSVEDPANPSGNDLSDLLNAGVRAQLSAVAARTLTLIEASGWEAVFGPVEETSKMDRQQGLRRAAASVTAPTKPWRQDA